MRIDFREERKWKIALAYTLAVAVQEWHAAGSVEERVRRGICFIWSKPRYDDSYAPGTSGIVEETEDVMQVDEEPVADSMPLGDYGSDDGSDDDQDKDQGDVPDPLDTTTLFQDALAQSNSVEPKIEDIDDVSFRIPSQQQPSVDADAAGPHQGSQNEPDITKLALKPTSQNPVLQSASNRAAIAAVSSSLRQKIAYVDTSKLFLDLDDFELEKVLDDAGVTQVVLDALPSFPDLTTLFPDLQTYGLPEAMPAVIQLDLKKNNRRDDPNRRAEDASYSKLTQVSKLMYCRPTLIGPLQPSRHWHNGEWSNLDDSAIYPSDGSKTQEQTCSASDPFALDTKSLKVYSVLFERIIPPNPSSVKPPPPLEPKRIPEPRIAEQLWTANDDAILKSLVEKYHNNWCLIADTLNTIRLSVNTDRRNSWDCFYRWTLPPNIKLDGDALAPSLTNLSNRPKRHAAMSASEAAAVASANINPEARKRKRHIVMQEAIRKVTKKRDQLAKAAGAVVSSPDKVKFLSDEKLQRIKNDRLSSMILTVNTTRWESSLHKS